MIAVGATITTMRIAKSAGRRIVELEPRVCDLQLESELHERRQNALILSVIGAGLRLLARIEHHAFKTSLSGGIAGGTRFFQFDGHRDTGQIADS